MRLSVNLRWNKMVRCLIVIPDHCSSVCMLARNLKCSGPSLRTSLSPFGVLMGLSAVRQMCWTWLYGMDSACAIVL